MPNKSVRLALLILGFVSALACAEEVPVRADLNESVVMLPVPATIGSVDLQTTIYRPDGDGPFPLVIINHGKSLGGGQWQERERYPLMAEEFLARGYVVALPMRRGFAGSGGRQADTGCSFAANGWAQARDIAGVIGWFKQQPWIDGNRILVIGQSHGGMTALALASQNVPGVRAVLNFAGGLRGSGADQCHSETGVASAYADYGATAKVDTLWFYGQNDSLFPPELAKTFYQRYTAAGGKAELVAYDAFRQDAHGMFGTQEGFDKIWWPKAEPFLAAHGLPVAVIQPNRYHEPATPAASGYAAADDLTRLPTPLHEGCKALYERTFMHAPDPKAFAISADGACGGGVDYGDDAQVALRACRTYAAKKDSCQLYLVNDSVVWPKPAS